MRLFLFVLTSLLLFNTVSCAKKHRRGRPDEVRITAGSQAGGTEQQGGLEQVTAGQGGDGELFGGVPGNQGGNIGGGASGNDGVGGTGGDPIDVPVAGRMNGSGGDEVAVGGIQGEGGQGGDGGETIVEPEPRELRFAPTPWPISPELGLQSYSDFESCGDIPLVNLQPMFEEIINQQMDCDPDSGECEVRHWVYKGPTVFQNNVHFQNNFQRRDQLFFEWTAEQEDEYTFQFAYQFNQDPFIPEIDILEDCQDLESSIANPNRQDAFVSSPEEPGSHTKNVWIHLNAGQTVYILLTEELHPQHELPAEPIPSLIQVFRRGDPEPPVLEEISVSKDEERNLYRIRHRGHDANADAMHLQVQFISEDNRQPISVFVNENDNQGLDDDASWYDIDLPFYESRPHIRRITTRSTWGVRTFQGFDSFFPHAFLSYQDVSFMRVRLCDVENLCSNVLETEVKMSPFVDQPDDSCINDYNCEEDSICRYSEVANQAGEEWPYRCIERTPSSIENIVAHKTDDVLFLLLESESPTHDLTSFQVELLDAQRQLVHTRLVHTLWDTHRSFEYYNHAESQTLFRGLGQIPLFELSNTEIEYVRVTGIGYSGRLSLSDPLTDFNTAPVEQAIAEPVIKDEGERCELNSIQELCAYGFVCESEEGEQSTCQPAVFPTIEDASGQILEATRSIHLDLTVTEDVIGYRLRGAQGLSEHQALPLDRIETIGGQKHGYTTYRLSLEVFENNRPGVIEVAAIHRNGYSSQWQEVNLEFVQSVPTCLTTGCEVGFECVRPDEAWVCLPPQPDPPPLPLPVFEAANSFYNPKTKTLFADITGRYEGAIEDPLLYARLSFVDLQGSILINTDDIDRYATTEMFDDGRFTIQFERQMDLRPSLDDFNIHLQSIAQLQWTNGQERFFDLQDFDELQAEEISTIRFPFQVVESLGENEPCDIAEIENYCEGALRCTETPDVALCLPVDDATCLPGTLNADLNQLLNDEGKAVLEGIRLDRFTSLAFGSCSTDVDPDNQDVHIFRFLPEEDGDYVFTQAGSFRSTYGPRMWIRRQCTVPESEIDCQSEERPPVVDGEDIRSVNSIVQLVAGEPVYVFAGKMSRVLISNSLGYSIEVAPLNPLVIQADSTEVRFNLETGAVEFFVDVSDSSSLSHMRNVVLEYQALDQNNMPILFQGNPDDPTDDRETWTLFNEDFQGGVSRDNRDFRSVQSHVPLSQVQLAQVTQFRIWLRAGTTRSNELLVNVDQPEVTVENCDTSGLYSVCADGFYCGVPVCGEGFSSRSVYDCIAINDECPGSQCQQDWRTLAIPLALNETSRWETSNTFAPEGEIPNDSAIPNEYVLRSGCIHPENDFAQQDAYVWESGKTHTYEFMAETPGRYRFHFSEDTSLLKEKGYSASRYVDRHLTHQLTMVVRQDCMNSATELGCGPDGLNGNNHDVTLDLTQNQTVYIHVSHDDSELTIPWPYTLQAERVR